MWERAHLALNAELLLALSPPQPAGYRNQDQKIDCYIAAKVLS